MADVETKEAPVVASPEKVEKCTKPVDKVEKNGSAVEKVENGEAEQPASDEVKEDANGASEENGASEKAAVVENGSHTEQNGKSNGSSNEEAKSAEPEEKAPETEVAEAEADANGTTDKPDACCIKRKSTGGDVVDAAKDVTSPKKAKVDE